MIVPSFSSLLAAALAFMPLSAAGAPPMEPLYDLREASSFAPQVFKIDTRDPIHLFPVPQDNSVGSNGLEEAITIFSFNKQQLRSKNLFKKAVVGMSPSGQYMPLLSKDAIGYGMTRGFTIFDFTHNNVRDFTIHTSVERDIEQVRASCSRVIPSIATTSPGQTIR